MSLFRRHQLQTTHLLYRLCVLLLLIPVNTVLLAQLNIVPNPGFETFISCPGGLSQLPTATPWNFPIAHTGTSDYYNACSGFNAGVPFNLFGDQPAHGGDAYIGLYLYAAGLSWREYAVAPLLQPLAPGGKYAVTAWVSCADKVEYTTNAMQFFFSNGPTIHNNLPFPMVQYTPQVAIPPAPFINNVLTWMQVGGNFIAAGGEDHVTIGNFLTDLNTPLAQTPGLPFRGAYVYIDDVYIGLRVRLDTTICLGSCADVWTVGDSSVVWTTTTSTVPLGTTDSLNVCPTTTTDYIATRGNQIDTVRVTVITAPTNVNVGPDSTICEGDSILLNSGIAHQTGYSYLWGPTGATTQTLSAQTGNIFKIVVSNVCGADSAAMQLTLQAQPTPMLVSDTALCFGQNITLDAGAGHPLYQWSHGPTTSTVNLSSSGTYAVTVTSSAGCEGMDTMRLVIAQPLAVNASGTDISCFGNANGTVSAAPTGTGPFSYQWNAPGAPTTSALSNLGPGTYAVTVTDSVGCTAVSQVIVLEPNPLGLILFANEESCEGRADGTATAVISGGTPPFTYIWSNGDTGPTADSLSQGSYSITVTDSNGCTLIDNISIGTHTVTVATFGTPAFCEGEGGDTLFANASGGDAPYYYTWWCDSAAIGNCGLDSIHDNDPLANPTFSGWYYVQAVDDPGCPSNVDSIYIEVLPKPIVDAGPDQYMCGDSAPCVVLTPTISGSPGPYSYQWIPAIGLNDPTILNPCARPDTTTIYTLVVTGGNGCSSDFTTTDTLSTVTVHVSPYPVADAGPDLDICFGDTVVLQGTGTGAGPLYTYQWSPTSGLVSSTSANPMAAPAMTTTYTLVAESNQCVSYADNVVVRVHTMPTVDAGPNREVCLGDQVMLDAQAGGDSTATYMYAWSPASDLNDPFAEDPLANPTATTTFFVQATSNWGCESSLDSVLVTLLPTPLAEAGDNLTICFGDSVELPGSYYYASTDSADPPGIFYAWNPALSLSDSTLVNPVAGPAGSGWYHLQVRSGTCQTEDSIFVTVFPEISITLNSDTSVACAGDPITLAANAGIGGATYEWLPSAGIADPTAPTIIVTPPQSTTYQVVVTEGACVDTAAIFLEILPTPAAAYFSSLHRGCAPLTVSFMQDASNATFYTWDFGDGSPVSNSEAPLHTFADPGIYMISLNVVGPGGCADEINTLQVEVTKPLLADFRSDPIFPASLYLPESTVNFHNLSQRGTEFYWDFGDGQVSNERDPKHLFTQPGTYQVKLRTTDASGCQSEVVHGPYMILPPGLFIPNVFSPNGDGINDVFRVDYKGSEPFTLQVYDRWGVELHTSANHQLGWNGNNQQGEAVPEGVYFYRVMVGVKEFSGSFTLVR